MKKRRSTCISGEAQSVSPELPPRKISNVKNKRGKGQTRQNLSYIDDNIDQPGLGEQSSKRRNKAARSRSECNRGSGRGSEQEAEMHDSSPMHGENESDEHRDDNAVPSESHDVPESLGEDSPGEEHQERQIRDLAREHDGIDLSISASEDDFVTSESEQGEITDSDDSSALDFSSDDSEVSVRETSHEVEERP